MIRKAMGKIIALIMLVALIATPLATLFFLSSHTKLAFDPQPKDIGVNTPVAVRVFESAWTAPIYRVDRTKRREHSADRNQEPGRSAEILAGAGSRSRRSVQRRKQGSAESEGRQSAAGGGSAVQRLPRRYRHASRRTWMWFCARPPFPPTGFSTTSIKADRRWCC